jgi:putative membrane protein
MTHHVGPFLLHWGITALCLWLASFVFRGLKFANAWSLILSALLLGFANAVVRPLLVFLTLPLTLLTLGLFLLVINALMILLVSAIVRGFKVSGFWTAFFASIFISVLSVVISAVVEHERPPLYTPSGTTWL